MTDLDGIVDRMSDARPRPSRWIRVSAWLFIFAVAAAFVLENLDGYHNEPRFSVDDYSREPPYINWSHGWPLVIFTRPSPEPANRTPPPAPGTGFRPPFPINSRWPIDAAPWRHFRPWGLAADLAICGLIVAGTTLVLLRWANRATRRPSYGLRTLLFYITASAVALFFINRDVTGALEAARYASELDLTRANSRFFIHAAALAVITFGGVLTIFAAFEIARAVLDWTCVRQRRMATTPTE